MNFPDNPIWNNDVRPWVEKFVNGQIPRSVIDILANHPVSQKRGVAVANQVWGEWRLISGTLNAQFPQVPPQSFEMYTQPAQLILLSEIYPTGIDNPIARLFLEPFVSSIKDALTFDPTGNLALETMEKNPGMLGLNPNFAGFLVGKELANFGMARHRKYLAALK